MVRQLLLLIAILTAFTTANAARRGSSGLSGAHQIGVGYAYSGAGQGDLDAAIEVMNGLDGTSAKAMSAGSEFYVDWLMRFSGSMFSIGLRPAYFTQNNGGGFSLTGYNIMPMFRMTPLENDFIKFFMQVGVGYASLSGTANNALGNKSASFNGSAFGAQSGIGVMFCFTSSHCMNIEGNVRYLPIERNIVNSCSGYSEGASNEFSQCQANKELERGTNNNDVKTSMSGVIGSIGYVLQF